MISAKHNTQQRVQKKHWRFKKFTSMTLKSRQRYRAQFPHGQHGQCLSREVWSTEHWKGPQCSLNICGTSWLLTSQKTLCTWPWFHKWARTLSWSIDCLTLVICLSHQPFHNVHIERARTSFNAETKLFPDPAPPSGPVKKTTSPVRACGILSQMI